MSTFQVNQPTELDDQPNEVDDGQSHKLEIHSQPSESSSEHRSIHLGSTDPFGTSVTIAATKTSQDDSHHSAQSYRTTLTTLVDVPPPLGIDESVHAHIVSTVSSIISQAAEASVSPVSKTTSTFDVPIDSHESSFRASSIQEKSTTTPAKYMEETVTKVVGEHLDHETPPKGLVDQPSMLLLSSERIEQTARIIPNLLSQTDGLSASSASGSSTTDTSSSAFYADRATPHSLVNTVTSNVTGQAPSTAPGVDTTTSSSSISMLSSDLISSGEVFGESSGSFHSEEKSSSQQDQPQKDSTGIIINQEQVEALMGRPLGLPSPSPPPRRSFGVRGPTPQNAPPAKTSLAHPIYLEVVYVPASASYDASFFATVRASNYVVSGVTPPPELFDNLLAGKRTWKENHAVTIVPTYESEALSNWIARNQPSLTKYNIKVAPAATRCTITLANSNSTKQETSPEEKEDQDEECVETCSAYKIEP